MQEEIFIATQHARTVTPIEFAEVLTKHGVLVRACAVESGWRLEFEDAPGTFADITTDSSGAAKVAAFCVRRLRDIDDFRRIREGFKQLRWQYCGSSFYDA